MGKRIFDLFVSILGIILLLPLFLVVALWITLDSRGGIFYRQRRVGKDGKEFSVIKFRTMRPDADKAGLLTVGGKDPRVTGSGYFLRKYKIDEFPQLFNVIAGDMSLVGPRPEVKKYTDLYTEEQRQVLSVRPGITDLASIAYAKENDLLAKAADPEKCYIEEIMPDKLRISLDYIRRRSLWLDLQILAKTFFRILS